MNSSLKNLSIDDRIRLVEDLWDSIAVDQNALPLTQDQKLELDKRLDAYAATGDPGRLIADVIPGIRDRL